jgi:hypothetical protein
MSQIISRISKPVRRKGAESYLQLSLLSFAASVSLTRFILFITGYPQLGNETFHIAHVLYGGVLLYIGILVPLIYANRWAYTWSSILSGVGVGLFIDEVGKFITQNNDYFFPAAAPIIYAFFLISVLIYTRVAKEAAFDTRTELYAVLESLGSAIDHDMDPEEHSELRGRLQRIKENAPNTDFGLLSNQILEFVNSDSIHIAPDEFSIFDKAISWFSGFEARWLSQRRLKLIIVAGVFLLGMAGSIRLLYYLSIAGDLVSFESLLRERVANLSHVSGASLFWVIIQLLMEGLVGFILLISAILLFLGRERSGLEIGSIGLVVYLVGVNMIQFYLDQFSTVLKAIIQFLILQTMYYYQRRFRIK